MGEENLTLEDSWQLPDGLIASAVHIDIGDFREWAASQRRLCDGLSISTMFAPILHMKIIAGPT